MSVKKLELQRAIAKDSSVESDLATLLKASNIVTDTIGEMWLSIPLENPRLLETMADFNMTIQRLNIKGKIEALTPPAQTGDAQHDPEVNQR